MTELTARQQEILNELLKDFKRDALVRKAS